MILAALRSCGPVLHFLGTASTRWVCQVPLLSERRQLFGLRVRLARAAGYVLPWRNSGRRWMSVIDVYTSKISFRSRSGLARPNSCIFRALILLTVPSTAPELYGWVSPAVTASRSRCSPRVNERSVGRS